ncbi:MAG TPA: threonylcarbamoyl-AMP synthase [Bacteroidaceae bacterium]|nr:threonylcarbamoyl-AMP synthase [Bacteroidaceae bacterium]
MNIEIDKTLQILQNGGTILYPTDTIWGIGCDPANPEAVQKIYEIKKRDDRKSMLVLIDSVSMLTSYITDVPNIAYELIGVTDKPLTIVYPGARNLAANLIAEDGSLGIRVTIDPFCQQLIRRFGRPIVSTSANQSGETSPATFREISEKIINSVDYVVDWRRDEQTGKVSSSIIKIDIKGYFKILRP